MDKLFISIHYQSARAQWLEHFQKFVFIQILNFLFKICHLQHQNLQYLISLMSDNTSESLKDRNSDTTNDSYETIDNSAAIQDVLCNFCVQKVLQYNFRDSIFVSKDKNLYITLKKNRKAIQYIMSLCWTKNCQRQTFYLACLIYYAYKANQEIHKTAFEITLCVIVNLAMKMNEPAEKFKMKEQFNSTTDHNVWQIQADILEVLNYDLDFNTTFYEYLWSCQQLKQLYNSQRSQQINYFLKKLEFLLDIFIMEGPDVLVNAEKFRELVECLQNIGSEQPQWFNDLLKISGKVDILLQKHSSRLDVEAFLSELSV